MKIIEFDDAGVPLSRSSSITEQTPTQRTENREKPIKVVEFGMEPSEVGPALGVGAKPPLDPGKIKIMEFGYDRSDRSENMTSDRGGGGRENPGHSKDIRIVDFDDRNERDGFNSVETGRIKIIEFPD